jgi:hypothetical protein
MCLGGQQPQAPQIVYQGPSDADIAANQAALDAFKTQITQQGETFQASLQKQIDDANAATEQLTTQFDNDAAAAAASSAAQQTTAYAVTASETEAPSTAQTTSATTKKKNPQSNLRISRAALPTNEGAGLNIGV